MSSLYRYYTTDPVDNFEDGIHNFRTAYYEDTPVKSSHRVVRNMSSLSRSDSHLRKKPHFAEGISVPLNNLSSIERYPQTHTYAGSSYGGYYNKGRLHTYTQDDIGSPYQSRHLKMDRSQKVYQIESNLPQVRVQKPCKITFKVESLPQPIIGSGRVDTDQEFETFSEKNYLSDYDNYTEGIVIQHRKMHGGPRSVTSEQSYSTNHTVQHTPKAEDNDFDVYEKTIEKREQVIVPESAPIINRESKVTNEVITTKQAEPQWEIVRHSRFNEKGEKVDFEVKRVMNSKGEWDEIDSSGAVVTNRSTFSDIAQNAVNTNTTTTTTTTMMNNGGGQEYFEGSETVRKADGTMEKIEYKWTKEGNEWVKTNKSTGVVITRGDTWKTSGTDYIQDSSGEWKQTSYSWTTNSNGEMIKVDQSGNPIITSQSHNTMASTATKTYGSAPSISGEYWIQRKKDNTWKRVRYHWVQNENGGWNKVNSDNGKILASQADWKHGTAWELNKKAVPRKVDYEWRMDKTGQWRMERKGQMNRIVDTSWQEGVEYAPDGTKTTYRWVQDAGGNWNKLNQNSGELIEKVPKGKGLNITRSNMRYFYHADENKLVKEYHSRKYANGKLVSEDRQKLDISPTESEYLLREAQSRRLPSMGSPPTRKGLKFHRPNMSTNVNKKVKNPIKFQQSANPAFGRTNYGETNLNQIASAPSAITSQRVISPTTNQAITSSQGLISQTNQASSSQGLANQAVSVAKNGVTNPTTFQQVTDSALKNVNFP